MVESGKVRSFVAEGYEPRFDRKQRELYGIAKGEEIATFVVAKLDWSTEFEVDVMGAILAAFKDHALPEFSVYRWVALPAGVSVKWEWRHEGDGPDAESRLGDLIVEDETRWPEDWLKAVLMWSSEDGRSKVIAWKTLSTTDFGNYPRAPHAGYEEFTMALFFLWGPMKAELLGLLESTVRRVEERFAQAEPSPDPSGRAVRWARGGPAGAEWSVRARPPTSTSTKAGREVAP